MLTEVRDSECKKNWQKYLKNCIENDSLQISGCQQYMCQGIMAQHTKQQQKKLVFNGTDYWITHFTKNSSCRKRLTLPSRSKRKKIINLSLSFKIKGRKRPTKRRCTGGWFERRRNGRT